MTSSQLRSLHPMTSAQWQDAFMRHAIERGGMPHDTALYEAAFAADDQADQFGSVIRRWESPAVVATRICACWDRKLLSSDDSISDLDFDFDLSFRPPSHP